VVETTNQGPNEGFLGDHGGYEFVGIHSEIKKTGDHLSRFNFDLVVGCSKRPPWN